AKRRFANLLPGEPFVLDLSDTAIGVRLVMRAGEIDYGEPGDAVVRAECVEDVFGMPATTYVEDPGEGGTPPDTTPRLGHRRPSRSHTPSLSRRWPLQSWRPCPPTPDTSARSPPARQACR